MRQAAIDEVDLLGACLERIEGSALMRTEALACGSVTVVRKAKLVSESRLCEGKEAHQSAAVLGRVSSSPTAPLLKWDETEASFS